MAWIAALAAGSAAAQSKISPRLQRSGGSAYVVVFRPGADMAQARERLRERGFDLIEHPDLRPRDVLAAAPRARLAEIGDWEEVEYVLGGVSGAACQATRAGVRRTGSRRGNRGGVCGSGAGLVSAEERSGRAGIRD